MIHGVTYDREDTCPDCKRKRALELYDNKDYSQAKDILNNILNNCLLCLYQFSCRLFLMVGYQLN